MCAIPILFYCGVKHDAQNMVICAILGVFCKKSRKV